MAKATVILLTGWAGSGKDEAGAYLRREYGFVCFSFADPLKGLVSEKYGIPLYHMHDRERKDAPVMRKPLLSPPDEATARVQAVYAEHCRAGFWTPRALCIMECDIIRAVDPHFWASKVAAQILTTEEGYPGGRYVVTDTRFPAEIEYLQRVIPQEDADIYTVRISRFDRPHTEHPSESALNAYKHTLTISNRGTLDEFRKTLDMALAPLLFGNG